MKHLVHATLLSLLAAPAFAAPQVMTFELDENYAEMAPAADEVPALPGDPDPNAFDDALPPIVVVKPEAVEQTSAPAVVADPIITPPPAPVFVAPKVPKAAPVVKAKPPVPRPIPLIDTRNEARSSPEVSYVTGGIGEDEKLDLQAKKPEYNLYVMSASTSGAFVGDARVVIHRKNGAELEEMLNVVAGPLLYVKLMDGNYVLDATLGELTKRQEFSINSKHKTSNVHLSWRVPTTLAE